MRDALEEDGAANDLTSIATIVSDRRSRCVIIAREAGVISGIPLAREAFRQRDPRASVRAAVRDGQKVNASTPVIFVTGHARGLLSAERVALNFMQRLSGVASLTRKYVDAVKGTEAKFSTHGRPLPAGDGLEKYAVRAGGGMNHRNDLSVRSADQGQPSHGCRWRRRARRPSKPGARTGGNTCRSGMRRPRSGTLSAGCRG